MVMGKHGNVYVAASTDQQGRVVARVTAGGMVVLEILDPAVSALGTPDYQRVAEAVALLDMADGWCITEEAARGFAEALAWLYPPELRARGPMP